MRPPGIPPLWIWAARDLLRRPAEALLLVAALASLITVAGTALLLTQALSHTASELLEDAPSLVVRKLDAGGWSPIPAAESVAAARSVPGVTRADVRVWGTVLGPEGPVTIVGMDDAAAETFEEVAPEAVRPPRRGEAVVGTGIGIASNRSDAVIQLTGASTMHFKICGQLSSEAGMAAHDVVLLQQDDARLLLGLPPGLASDLAVHVFHEEEEEAIIPDLAAAFPWPVSITTRTQSIGIYSAGYARRGGIAVITLLPAVLALAILTAATVRDRIGRRHEAGLLKALGWTTGDVVRMQMIRALLIAMPAAGLGMAAAAALTFWPGMSWPGRILLGWGANPPHLSLNPSGALLVLLEISAMALLPFFLATLWPAVRAAAADPQELLEGGSPDGSW